MCDIFLFVFLKKGNDNYLAIQLRFGFFRCLRSEIFAYSQVRYIRPMADWLQEMSEYAGEGRRKQVNMV